MAQIELPVYATLALCAGPVLFLRGFRDLRVRRMVQNTPTSKIRSMAMGLVEVHGTVLQRSAVHAPFSGKPCAYWEVEIAVRTNRKHGWTTVHRNTSGQPFYVDDGTGVAMVYPKGSTCRMPPGADEACLGWTLPEVYADYMKQQGLWMRWLWRIGMMRFRERVIEEGQRVFLLGTAEPRAQSRDLSVPDEAQLDRAAVAALAATGTDGPAFAARASAPTAAAIPTQPGPARTRALHARTNGVIRRGGNEPTFLISLESEFALTTMLGVSVFLKLFGGPLLTIFGLGYWLMALGSGPK
jgi:hypothetical protein